MKFKELRYKEIAWCETCKKYVYGGRSEDCNHELCLITNNEHQDFSLLCFLINNGSAFTLQVDKATMERMVKNPESILCYYNEDLNSWDFVELDNEDIIVYGNIKFKH